MNAIILAAGVGYRFEGMTRLKNKAFMSINKITLIERILIYLKAANINDITIVTGHMEASFLPLVEAYGVTLVNNKKYSTTNNITSLELVFDRFEDTYIIHSDVALFKNLFLEELSHTTCYTVFKNPKGANLPHPIIDKRRKMLSIENYAGNERVTTMIGVYYWKKEDAIQFKKYLSSHVTDKMRKQFHGDWEQFLPNVIDDIYIEGRQIDSKYGADINSVKDYFDAITIHDTYWRKDKAEI